MVDELRDYPDDIWTIRFDALTVGGLLRGRVRAAFNIALIHSAEVVEVHEERGLFNSVFTVRLRGRGTQLLPCLRQLAAMEQGQSS
jgi:hypothetical protein